MGGRRRGSRRHAGPVRGTTDRSAPITLADAGFEQVAVTIEGIHVRFPSVEAFIRREVMSSPLRGPVEGLEPEVRAAFVRGVEGRLEPWVDDLGLSFPMETWIVTRRAPGRRPNARGKVLAAFVAARDPCRTARNVKQPRLVTMQGMRRHDLARPHGPDFGPHPDASRRRPGSRRSGARGGRDVERVLPADSAAIGESPRAYVERLRLERAAVLLVVRAASVLEIALDSDSTATRRSRGRSIGGSASRQAGGATAPGPDAPPRSPTRGRVGPWPTIFPRGRSRRRRSGRCARCPSSSSATSGRTTRYRPRRGGVCRPSRLAAGSRPRACCSASPTMLPD